MTMISTVTLVPVTAVIQTEGSDDPAQVSDELGAPLITGNFLINGGRVQLINRKGETLIITRPIQVHDYDGILIHLAIGGEDRRIGHTITLEGLDVIIDNLVTIRDLARLEAKKD